MARGSIYRRTLKAGRPSKWYAVIDVPTGDGSRKQITRSFDSRREAEAWLTQMASERRVPSSGPTLAEFLPQWLDGKVGVKPSTRASYRAHVERYLVPRLGGVALRQLTPQEVACWHKDLMETGVEPATIARIHATLSTALATARRQGLIDRNPLDGVELPRRRPFRRTTWTTPEASSFLSGVRGDPLEGLWRLALLSGMRRGELLGLRWADVDLASGTATVDTTRLRLGGDIIEDGPKTLASHRTVHLEPTTVEVLRRAQALSTGGGNRHVFTDRDWRPLDPAAVTRRFQELREQFGLPRIRLHDLRHTSATLGLASGESLKEVSARLGHAAISVTADLYVDVSPELARSSALRLAASLEGPALRALDEGAA